MALIDKLSAIADAIRSKTGKTGRLTLNEMATEIAGISGGTELNFKVVGGTTEPINPIENMIWVNTDVEVAGNIFSSIEPTDTVDGTIWIITGPSSDLSFNALKNNSIIICPISAKQYIDGVWVNKEAKSYKNGAWVDWWDGVLYNNGDQCADVTGGWTSDGYSSSTAIKSGTHGERMDFNGTSSYLVLSGTDSPVSLSGKQTIKVIGELTSRHVAGSSTSGLVVAVSKTKNVDLYDAISSIKIVGKFNATLDISNLEGDYYISVRTEPYTNCKGYVTEIYAN